MAEAAWRKAIAEAIVASRSFAKRPFLPSYAQHRLRRIVAGELEPDLE